MAHQTIINLGDQDSILNHFIAELRDREIQKDRQRFRRNLERIGSCFAYEISKSLPYEKQKIHTTLAEAEVPVLKESPVVASIMRAGLPVHSGMLEVFDRADNAFVSLYRKLEKNEQAVRVEYCSSPDLDGKILILVDTMIATGLSAITAYRELMTYGRPARIHLVSILASAEGLEYVKKHVARTGVTIWLGAVDDELTAQNFIVPGLGDAGDLAYGNKD